MQRCVQSSRQRPLMRICRRCSSCGQVCGCQHLMSWQCPHALQEIVRGRTDNIWPPVADQPNLLRREWQDILLRVLLTGQQD
jgi:hypothetical protein